MRALRALVSAFSYFTVIPLGRLAAGPAPDAYALSFLPVVGAVIGAITALLVTLASHAPPLVAWVPVIALVAPIALTGAIHLDGFLDCCDGLLVTASPQRRLEILHDPRHGTFAVAGMFVLGVVWIAALSFIPLARVAEAVLFAAVLSRLGAILNAWFFPYGRGGTRASAFESRPSVAIVAVAGAIVAILAESALGWSGVLLLPLAAVVAVACALFASRRLGGGITGDVYGAIVVVTEVAVLIAFPLLTAHL